MAETPARTRNRLYLLHRLIGLAIGALGTLVLFSGTVAVFHEEIDSWADRRHAFPAVHTIEGFALERAYRAALQEAPEPYRHHVAFEQQPGGPLRVLALDAEQRRGVSVTLDPVTLEALQRREGSRAELIASTPRSALARFILDLHVYLLMPSVLGLLATGLIGVGLLMLLFTGLLVHRPSWRRLRRPPRRSKRRRFLGDLHTLVGSWSLPFTLIVASTGAFFSLSGITIRPAIAVVAYGGDNGAMLRELVGTLEVPKSEGTASLDPLLADALARAEGSELRRLQLEGWGQPGAKATLTLVHRDPLGDAQRRLVYDGQSGELIGEKPEVGVRSSFGSWLLELVDALHFGTLVGVVTKALWFGLGIVTCVLAATGTLVFVARQRDEHALVPRLMRGLAVASSAGLPLTLAVCVAAWSWCCARGLPDPSGVMVGSLLLGLSTTTAVGVLWPLERSLTIALGGGGLGLLSMPMLASLANGLPLHEAWTRGLWPRVAAVDVVVGLFGLGLLLLARALGRRRRPRPLVSGSSEACPPR